MIKLIPIAALIGVIFFLGMPNEAVASGDDAQGAGRLLTEAQML